MTLNFHVFSFTQGFSFQVFIFTFHSNFSIAPMITQQLSFAPPFLSYFMFSKSQFTLLKKLYYDHVDLQPISIFLEGL